jgi:threonine aldolase
LSITQVTETGTVYSVAEIQTLAETARKFGLRVQMDGARFANAVASLGVAPADITWRAGVDVLCFGGSKNGIALGEAVIFSTANWRAISITAANKAGSLRPKCVFSPRRGWAGCKTARGYSTRGTQTKWRNCLRPACEKFPA